MNKNILKFFFVLMLATGIRQVSAEILSIEDGGGAGTFVGGTADGYGEKYNVDVDSAINADIEMQYDLPEIIAMAIHDETNTIPSGGVFGIEPTEISNLFKVSKFNYPSAPTDDVIAQLLQTTVEDPATAASNMIPLLLASGVHTDFEINGILFTYPRELSIMSMVDIETDPSCDRCIFLDGPDSARIQVNLFGLVGDPAGDYNTLTPSGAGHIEGFLLDTMMSSHGYAALRIGGDVDGGSMSVSTTPPGVYTGTLKVSFIAYP